MRHINLWRRNRPFVDNLFRSSDGKELVLSRNQRPKVTVERNGQQFSKLSPFSVLQIKNIQKGADVKGNAKLLIKRDC